MNTFIIARRFSVTPTNFSNPSHRLYKLVNWDRIEAGEYALVDPVDSGQILYLTEPDYIILVRQSLNSGHRPIILARPTDSRPLSSSPSQDGSQNSPPEWFLGRRLTKGPIHLRYKSLFSWVPKVVRRFGLREQVENLAVVDHRNMRPLFMIWAIHLYVKIVGLSHGRVLRKETRAFATDLISILEAHGVSALVLRLKVMHHVLLSFIGGKRITCTQDLGIRVRLTNGLPKILPKSAKMAIRSKNLKVIRIWISILYVYKALESGHKAPDFKAIGKPFVANDSYSFVETRFSFFVKDYFVPWLLSFSSFDSPISLIPEKLFMAPTAGPNHSLSIASYPIDTLFWIFNGWGASPLKRYMEAIGAESMLKLFESYAIEMMKFVMDDNWKEGWDQTSSGQKVAYSEEELGHYFPEHAKLFGPKGNQFKGVNPSSGKLSLIKEAAGKVRVVAIPDAWTQTVLAPLHKLLFKWLKVLPTDGTFDQQGSVRSFAEQGFQNCYSFDLKAATDTIPYLLYGILLKPLIGENITLAWLSLLRDRVWKLPSWQATKNGKEVTTPLTYGADKSRYISYGRGQPMGALSSWGALALLHHAVVQYSAFLVGLFPFYDYRVLGDDVVIAGKGVARSYRETCSHLGIEIGIAKSFLSENGFFNFANQSYLGRENVSPISFKQELSANTGFARLAMVTQAIGRGWIDTTSPGFFQACLRYMLPPLYCLQVEASRKVGKVHEAAVTCASLIFRGMMEGVIPLPHLSEGLSSRVISSELVNPGLSLFAMGLEQLALHSPVTGWSARELLGRFILKQIDRIELALEERLGQCEELSPPYGFVRFNWPSVVSVPGKGSYPIDTTLPLLERVSEWATELVDSIVVGLSRIRFICSGVRLELPLVMEESSLSDMLLGYQRLLHLEREVTQQSLSGVGVFGDESGDPENSESLLDSVLLSADLAELARLGVDDHSSFSESFGLDLVRMRTAIYYASIAEQTRITPPVE